MLDIAGLLAQRLLGLVVEPPKRLFEGLDLSLVSGAVALEPVFKLSHVLLLRREIPAVLLRPCESVCRGLLGPLLLVLERGRGLGQPASMKGEGQ